LSKLAFFPLRCTGHDDVSGAGLVQNRQLEIRKQKRCGSNGLSDSTHRCM
jgi:hypothetical protein